MEAPKCIVCGTKHRSRQPCPAAKGEARKIAESVTKPQEPNVTKLSHIVTKPVAVTKLKGGRPPIGDKAMTQAERARRYRQRNAK
jgi:hypothetical protein